MKKQVIRTSDEAARLASVRVRIARDPYTLPPWDRDNTDAPLLYWSPDYTHDKNATDAPTVEDDDGNETTAPGILRATVYAYEHGGVVVSTKQTIPAGCACGCVWCTADAFREYYGPGADFEKIAAEFVAEIDAFYNGGVYCASVEEWNAAARDWTWIDGVSNVYPGTDDAETLAELIAPGIHPGRVVCVDDDSAEFVGMEYDDGAPESVAV